MRKYSKLYIVTNSRKYYNYNLSDETIKSLPDCNLKNNNYKLLSYILNNYINKLDSTEIFKEREVIVTNSSIHIRSLIRYDENIDIELVKDNIKFNIFNSKLNYFYNKNNNSYYTITNGKDYYDTYETNSSSDSSNYYDFVFSSLEKYKKRVKKG